MEVELLVLSIGLFVTFFLYLISRSEKMLLALQTINHQTTKTADGIEKLLELKRKGK